MFDFSYIELAYRAPSARGACAINTGGSNQFHERCQCRDEDISTCKDHCDDDINCKGYVGPTGWDACQWATTSECPSGCSKYDQGHVGEILWDDDHHSDNYPGCFIKLEGKITLKTIK